MLPDGVPTYQVLLKANLSAEQQQLARATTTELKYIMVAQLKKISGNSIFASAISTKDVEAEPLFYGESYHRKLYDSNYLRQPNYKKNIQQNKKHNQRHFQKSWKTNPLDHSAKRSRCSTCQSNFQWARNCPHAFENMTWQKNQNNGGQKNTNGNNTYINLFTNIQYDEMKQSAKKLYITAIQRI